MIIGCEKYINDLHYQSNAFRIQFPDCYVIPIIGKSTQNYLGVFNVDCPDEYRYLPRKVREGMRLIINQLPDVDMIIKVDDDIAFNQDEWLLLKSILPYVNYDSYIGGGFGNTKGLTRTNGRNDISPFIHQTKYVYGGLNIYGKNAAQMLCDNEDLRCDLEDVTAGHVLTSNGYIPTSFGYKVRERDRT